LYGLADAEKGDLRPIAASIAAPAKRRQIGTSERQELYPTLCPSWRMIAVIETAAGGDIAVEVEVQDVA
jgi:hypothetical protein